MSEEVTESEQTYTVKFHGELQDQNIRIHSLQCATTLLRTEPTTHDIPTRTLELAKRFEYYIRMGE